MRIAGIRPADVRTLVPCASAFARATFAYRKPDSLR